MDAKLIDQTMQGYLQNQEMAGGALLVRKNGELIYRAAWGWSDMEKKKPIDFDSVYRMMSMTKCVTAVAVMQLIEQGKVGLDEPLSCYLPAFDRMQVCTDPRYTELEGMEPALLLPKLLPKLLTFDMKKVKTVPADRPITIRDLLSHSSGLEQGVVGLLAMLKDKRPVESLARQAEKYASYVLGFQPGTGTGYSPVAGFDVLGRVVEVVSGLPLDQYLQENLFQPLEMHSTTFHPSGDVAARLVRVYRRKKNRLADVTGTKDDMDGILHRCPGYLAACGGLFSTVEDYEKFAWMLCAEGRYQEQQILQPETVRLMAAEAPALHLEPEPGQVWGLGVRIRQDPLRGGSPCTPGTYGWSGAFGTHFFVSPADRLDAVWVTNRTDLGGSGSYISKRVEELVFGCFA